MQADVSKARIGASSAPCDAHAGGVREGESRARPPADADDELERRASAGRPADCAQPEPPPSAPRALISDPRSREPQDNKATAWALLGAVLGVTLTAVVPVPRRPCGLSSSAVTRPEVPTATHPSPSALAPCSVTAPGARGSSCDCDGASCSAAARLARAT